jgi:hypothetical protein
MLTPRMDTGAIIDIRKNINNIALTTGMGIIASPMKNMDTANTITDVSMSTTITRSRVPIPWAMAEAGHKGLVARPKRLHVP